MSNALIVEILLAMIAATIGVSTYVQARRANSDQVKMVAAQAQAATASVDAGAYARAKEIYDGALITLREELASARRDIIDLRKELIEAKRSNAELRVQVESLRAQLARLGPGV